MIDAPKNAHRAPRRPLDGRTLALTSLGLGFLRPAPGTWGSMPPVALMLLLVIVDAAPEVYDAALLALLSVSCMICVAFGGYAERRFGRKDAGEVVIDETAGQCLPLLLLPMERVMARMEEAPFVERALIAAVMCGCAFVLFRVFDIVKPWPARRLERLPRGWGVLLDDLMAGAYAALVVWAAIRLIE